MKTRHLWLIVGFILINIPVVHSLNFWVGATIVGIGGSMLIHYGEIKHLNQ